MRKYDYKKCWYCGYDFKKGEDAIKDMRDRVFCSNICYKIVNCNVV